MKSATKTILTVSLAILAATATAQEIAYLDLTGVTQRSELRHPPAPPAKCNDNGICTSGGFEGLSIGCGGSSPGQLRTSLLWVDQSDYFDGDDAEIESRIENVGTVPIDIPSGFHLADLQPSNENESFEVYTFQIGLFLIWGERYSTSLGWLNLYGSEARTGSMITLKPGEWMRVRGRIGISLAHVDGMKLPPPDSSQRASAGILLRRIQYRPHPGGVAESISNISAAEIKGTELSIRVLPVTDMSN